MPPIPPTFLLKGQLKPMLIPLTRKKFEQLIPLAATGAQYRFYWGKFPDFLKRLLFSIAALVGVFFILRPILGEAGSGFLVIIEIPVFLYWLWAPVLWASLRNSKTRKYPYSGFWRGKVLDAYPSDAVIGQEETVNNKGQLVIVENRERRLNLVVGDETGFELEIQVPLKRSHQGVAPGQVAEMLVLSYEPDLETIVMNTDIFIPSRNIWVSDYPYVQRDAFTEVSRKLRDYQEPRRPSKKSSRKKDRFRDDYDFRDEADFREEDDFQDDDFEEDEEPTPLPRKRRRNN
ncbi:MAG: phosphate ABC transporter permease [Leptolyngbyaceae cyanobacterium bins.59]|nr:phosphate ABC transporter permease [Leptolyngbyaceae cyanobacterium bins.59]